MVLPVVLLEVRYSLVPLAMVGWSHVCLSLIESRTKPPGAMPAESEHQAVGGAEAGTSEYQQ